MTTQEKINEFTCNDIKLEMFWSGKTDKRGTCQMEYKFWKGDILLHEGNDFCLGASQYPDSVDAVVSLLGFLTVQEHDTNADYFKGYSPEMWNYIRSFECEQLKGVVSDFENGDTKEWETARVFFETNSKINAF